MHWVDLGRWEGSAGEVQRCWPISLNDGTLSPCRLLSSLHGWRKGTAAAAVQCGDKYQVCTRRARNDIKSRAQKPKTNNPERWPRHPDRHMSFGDLRTCHLSMTAVTNVVSGLRRHVVVQVENVPSVPRASAQPIDRD